MGDADRPPDAPGNAYRGRIGTFRVTVYVGWRGRWFDVCDSDHYRRPGKASASAQGIPLLGPAGNGFLALLLGATGVVAVNLRRRNPFGPGGSAQ